MPLTSLPVLFASHGSSLQGGAERSLCDLAIGLCGDGRVSPTVAVPEEGELSDALRRGGVKSVVLPMRWWATDAGRFAHGGAASAREVWTRGKRVLGVARHVPPWVEFLRAQRPAVVVTNTATIPLPALASWVTRTPHVWWVREMLTPTNGITFMYGRALSLRVVRALSDLVVVNSEAVRAHYAGELGSGPVRIIHVAVEAPAPTANSVVPGELRVVLLGNLSASKGARLAVEALTRLRDDEVKVRLRMRGWIVPAFRAELEGLAAAAGVQDRLDIGGWAPDPFAEIASANALLMASKNEAFGRVTIEALKSGRPVVGSRSGGTVELVSDEVNGLLFERDDADDLACVLRRLGTEPGLLDRLSTTALETRDRFTIEQLVDDTVDALRSVPAERQSQVPFPRIRRSARVSAHRGGGA